MKPTKMMPYVVLIQEFECIPEVFTFKTEKQAKKFHADMLIRNKDLRLGIFVSILKGKRGGK